MNNGVGDWGRSGVGGSGHGAHGSQQRGWGLRPCTTEGTGEGDRQTDRHMHHPMASIHYNDDYGEI